jgi:alkylation response protein AidB-like acyl-CoA dehydrogenase
VRFAFDDDQLAFRDAVRDLLAKGCPPEVVRAAWPDGTDDAGARKGEGARADDGRVAKVWADLADMGVLGLAVSEDHGGLGMGPVDWVLLAEETGYAALPHPFVETACVVAPLLSDAGDPDGVLAALVDGTRQVTVVPPGSGIAPWAGDDTYLVRFDHQSRADRFTVAHVQPHNRRGGGVQLDQEPALDEGRRPSVLGHWGPVSGLGDDTQAAAAFHRGALGTAAQLVGLGRRMLDLTVAYVADRKQFGVPVGSQQAVKHHLADAAMKLRFAAPAVYGAAWSLATDQPTAHRDVSMAKALASDAARLTARQALQCHGAIGYTTEYDLHLYLKRAEALSRSWGDAAWHRDRVATALGI